MEFICWGFIIIFVLITGIGILKGFFTGFMDSPRRVKIIFIAVMLLGALIGLLWAMYDSGHLSWQNPK